MTHLAERWRFSEPDVPVVPLLVLVAGGVLLTGAIGPKVVAAAILLVIVASAAASVRFGVLALAALAPFDGYIGPMVLYRDFLVTDVVGAAVIVGQVSRGAALPARSSVVPAAAALAVLGGLHVLSLGPDNWQLAADNVARFFYFVALVLAVASTRDAALVRAGLVALCAGEAIRFSLEAAVYFTSPQFVLHPSFQFGALTSNPNSLAGFGACLLPVAASLLFVRRRAVQVFGAAVTGLLVVGILLSYSKGSWVTASAAGVVWVWHLAHRGWLPSRRMLAAAAAVLVAGVLVTPVLRSIPSLIVERWQSHGSTISNEERLRYVETAARVIVAHPFTGVGLERFGSAYVAARRVIRGPDDPHNAYLMVAAELGLPALGCYLLFLGIVTVHCYRRARLSGSDIAPYAIGLSAATVGLLVMQLFSAEPLASRIFWVLAALAITPWEPERAAGA